MAIERIEKLIKEKELTRDDVVDIYYYQLRCFTVQDVIAHAEELLASEMINEKDFKSICDESENFADLFLDEYSDCNVPENYVYETMLMDYVAEINNEKEN